MARSKRMDQTVLAGLTLIITFFSSSTHPKLRFLMSWILFFTFAPTSDLLSQPELKLLDFDSHISVPIEDVDSFLPNVICFNCRATIQIVEEILFPGPCLGTLYREYEISSDAGEFFKEQQYIKITDKEAPVLHNLPPEKRSTENMLTQSEDGNYFGIESVYATDNSMLSVDVNYKEWVSQPYRNRDRMILIREWSSKDECGNKAKYRQECNMKNGDFISGNNKDEYPKTQITSFGFGEGLRFQVYPNPAKSHVTFDFGNDGDRLVTISLYNLSGNIAIEAFNGVPAMETNEAVRILTDELAEGLYIYQVKSDEFIQTGRLVITK
jgi:hypothetical protein